MGRFRGPVHRKFRVGPRDATRRVRPARDSRGKLLKFEKKAREAPGALEIMYSPPPDEAAEALARDPIDPVEETERFLEDAAADTDEPARDEIL